MESTTVAIGGETVEVERVSALKASRAFSLLKQLNDKVPELTRAWVDYRTQYERENSVELDRAQARLRFPPQPLIDPETRAPLREPDEVRAPDGSGLIPNPRAGQLVYVPSPVDHMTEQDWKASGDKLRLPDSPTTGQLIAAVFSKGLEVAEENVYRLIALLTLPNAVVFTAWRSGGGEAVQTAIDERVGFLLGNAYMDELLELAVVCGETVDEQFRRKAEALGSERLGKALRLLGMDPAKVMPTRTTSTPSSTPTDSTPTSSTDGPESSDGVGETSSTPRSTSSSDSPAGSTTSEPSLEQTSTT